MRLPNSIRQIVAWVAFPIVPVVLARAYYDFVKGILGMFGAAPAPQEWSWEQWSIQLGPLIGFGFLAGATLRLRDPTLPTGWRGWIRRRTTWLMVGPWLGFLVWMLIFYGLSLAGAAWKRVAGEAPSIPSPPIPAWCWQVLIIALVYLTFAYAWVWFALLLLRRARSAGVLGRAIARGLLAAVLYVGSLVGTYWAIIQAWRDYFHNPRALQIATIAGVGLALACLEGCGTVGQARSHALFEALLAAWVLGFAFLWRWWDRPRG